MSWADLSYVLPVTSTSYVLIAIVGALALGERVPPHTGAVFYCISCGDILNTLGMRHDSKVCHLEPNGFVRLARALARNRYVAGGILAMTISFFAPLALLSVANVSFAAPATAGSFLLETLLAKIVLTEDRPFGRGGWEPPWWSAE